MKYILKIGLISSPNKAYMLRPEYFARPAPHRGGKAAAALPGKISNPVPSGVKNDKRSRIT